MELRSKDYTLSSSKKSAIDIDPSVLAKVQLSDLVSSQQPDVIVISELLIFNHNDVKYDLYLLMIFTVTGMANMHIFYRLWRNWTCTFERLRLVLLYSFMVYSLKKTSFHGIANSF